MSDLSKSISKFFAKKGAKKRLLRKATGKPTPFKRGEESDRAKAFRRALAKRDLASQKRKDDIKEANRLMRKNR